MNQPRIHRLTQVSSTQDVIHEYASRGAPHGTVIIAEEQLQGRGTRGRTWHSPPGGFWFSILYRVGCDGAIDLLSLRIGLAVAMAVESVVNGVRLGIKWPNDIMLGDRKLGGVLSEARWQGATLGWIAVGVGLNVSNPIPRELESMATGLATGAPKVTPEGLVAPIATALRDLALNMPGLSASELAEFRGRDWLQGRRLLEPVAGIARGVESDGSLLVERPDGTTASVRAGHVILG